MLHVRPDLTHHPRPDRNEQALRRAVDRLEQENRELRARLETFLPQDDLLILRRRYGMTPAEAAIFLILVRRGVATYAQIESTIYNADQLAMINQVPEAIRSHIKRLRKKAKAMGIEFGTIYGIGFEASEAMRARAKSMLASVPA
jgi:DNA-binding response OmpR family regulator